MYASTHYHGRTLSYRDPSARNEQLRNQVEVPDAPTQSCSYTFTTAFTGLYTGFDRKATTTGQAPCRPAEIQAPTNVSAGSDQSMRGKYLTGENPFAIIAKSSSSTGFTAATASPTTPGDPSPSGPEVLVLDESPTFHAPADMDDVDGKRIPLSEALRNEIPPCRHCFPGWSR